MVALTVAATKRWSPDQDVHDIDENAPPAFGDEEYNDFLSLVQEVADASTFREVARFFDIPEEVINKVLTDALSAHLSPSAPAGKSGLPVVIHKRHGVPR